MLISAAVVTAVAGTLTATALATTALTVIRS